MSCIEKNVFNLFYAVHERKSNCMAKALDMGASTRLLRSGCSSCHAMMILLVWRLTYPFGRVLYC
jgi:hypothetical protein